MRSDRYAAVKKLCYTELAVPCQCIMQKTLSNEKRLNSVVQKIALQMNCKLGGELWGAKIPIKNLVVIGVDVYRNKSGSSGNVAGVVCTLNSTFSKFYSKLVFEKKNYGSGGSFVGDISIVLQKALKRFHDHNGGVWPDKVIIYRDGVTAGSLHTAKRESVEMAESIKLVSPNSETSVVFVQKRLDAKFYSIPPSGDLAKVENPPPGTVIDHTATLRDFYDFFLVPMNVNFGTVTPVHFVVFEESEVFKPEIMQRVTYVLTHMYFNWPGNVKVPAPCQYAHKLVEMAGEHLHRETRPELEETLFYL